MIHFHNGPADGRSLSLTRSPMFLRVVIDGDKLDALDQLDDKPASTESIHVYLLKGGVINIRVCGKGTRPIAHYYHFGDVDEALIRETDSWHKWVNSAVDRVFNEFVAAHDDHSLKEWPAGKEARIVECLDCGTSCVGRK